MELTGKKVLITGSTDGLGKLLALTLSKMGAKVIVHGRNLEKVNKVVAETGAERGIVCDFNKPETIPSTFSEINELDILINNAGTWFEGRTLDISTDRLMEIVNTNISSHLLISRFLLPVLMKSEFAQILNTVSIAGVEIPFDYFHTIYSATKYGMQGFTEALAKEFDNKNLRVMGFYPGGMETKIFEKAGNDYKEHEPWMFNPKESVDAIVFMLTRDPKVSVKRLDLVNQLQK